MALAAHEGPTSTSRRARTKRRFRVATMAVVATGSLAVGSLATGMAAASSTSGASGSAVTPPTNHMLGIPASPHRGGSLTVLEGTGYIGSWPGLDPATDTEGGANYTYLDAIYGQLFELGPGGKLLPDLATGYRYSNGDKTITITLRKGVRFSDGTPFTSSAVKVNWERDLRSTCSCKPTFTQTAPPIIRTEGPSAISLTLQYVDASFLHSLPDQSFTWIASPTALKRMGEKAFALKPVGAGPFEVVSDTPGTQLVLRRNPHYFQQGLPYLNELTFKSVADDESALEAMEAGSGQAYEFMSTPGLRSAFARRYQVATQPSMAPYDIQLNTAVPPFNNLKARQAVYDAIDCPLLDKKLYGGQEPCGESFEAPAGLFYEKRVPGYLTYDPAMARQLVKQLGGISFSLDAGNAIGFLSLAEGIQSELQAVGMQVSLHEYDLSAGIAQFLSGKWQAFVQTAGSFDPSAGLGIAFRFGSTSPFSGVHSMTLDGLIDKANGTLDAHARRTYFNAIAEYLARNALAPFLFPINQYDIADRGVSAPGLTTSLPSVDGTEILWQYASTGNR